MGVRGGVNPSRLVYSIFLDFDGKQGEYTRRFAVYNQKSDIKGNPVIRETTRDGRTSFWVSEIQK